MILPREEGKDETEGDLQGTINIHIIILSYSELPS